MMRGLIITLLCIVAGCATWTAQPLRAQIRTVPRSLLDSLDNPVTTAGSEAMHFERQCIDVGHILEEEPPRSFTFRWQNRGERTLSVTRVQTTCGCARPAFGKSPVPVNAWSEISVTYNPKGHSGVFHRKIFVYTQLSNTQPTAVLELKGEVIPAGIATAGAYPFAMGNLRLKQQCIRFDGTCARIERIECLNSSGQSVRITANRQLLPPGIEVVCEPEEIAPGATADIVVRFDPAGRRTTSHSRCAVLLEGIAIPPGQRTLYIGIGHADNEK